MTQRQIAALAVRVLALYALFDSMKMISSVFSLVGFYSARTTLPAGSAGIMQAQAQGAFAQFFLLAGFALFLWFFADGLASFMVKDDAEATSQQRTSNSELQTIAFASIGILVALQAADRLATTVTRLISNAHLGNPDPQFLNRAEIFGSLVMLVLGCCLVFGARGFVRFIREARDIGRDPEIMRDKALPEEPPNS